MEKREVDLLSWRHRRKMVVAMKMTVYDVTEMLSTLPPEVESSRVLHSLEEAIADTEAEFWQRLKEAGFSEQSFPYISIDSRGYMEELLLNSEGVAMTSYGVVVLPLELRAALSYRRRPDREKT